MTNSTANKEPSPSPAKKKRTGPIRWGAVIPALILTTLVLLYGRFALDDHLRRALVWSAEQVHGAEINLKDLNISFIKGDLTLKGLQITDKEEPNSNLLEIGEVTFNLNTYELLKAKFIVDQSEVSGIRWNVPRKKPGKIYPPSARKSQELEKIEKATLKTAQQEFKGNALGNVANVLAGSSTKTEINDIKEELITEQKIDELEKEIKEKEEAYKERLSRLKSQEDFDKIKDEAKSYKWNDKDPIGSLKKLNQLIKSSKTTADQYKSDLSSIQADLKKVRNVSQNIDQWVEQDLEKLKGKVGIPELNAEDIAFSLLGGYFGNKVASFRKYSEVAKEYMPPPKSERKEEEIIPPQRGEGKTYNFPKKGENPKYWIKEIKVSSQAGKSEYGGNLSGHVKDITSSPKLINKPVSFLINGNFPKQELYGLELKGTFDHRTEKVKQNIQIDVDKFPFKGKELSSSEDLGLKLLPAQGKLSFGANKAGESVQVELISGIPSPQFEVKAKKKLVGEIVENSLKGMKELNIRARAQGSWEDLKWNFRSNLGQELSQGFKQELGNRVAEAKMKLKEKIRQKIGPKKEKYEAKVKEVREGISQSLNQQKDKAEGELKELLNELKGKQGKTLEKKTKKIEKKAKKLLKKLF